MSAASDWRRLVRARLRELHDARSAAGLVADLWSPARSRRFAKRVGIADSHDPLLRRLLAERASSYLDVGAGSGRHAIALADRGREVAAVEPSVGMRVLLRADPRIRVIGEPWPDAVAPNAEVVYSANVLFLIEDAAEFLAAMSRHADRACYIAVAAVHSDAAIDPLWRIFHGRRLAPCPTYLDAVAILEELGARPRVDIVAGPPQRPWSSIASAVADLAENVAVGRNDQRRRLGKELRRWLLETPGGFITPMGVPTTALINWAPGRRMTRPSLP